jgi:glucose/arabinose dehydrogenase
MNDRLRPLLLSAILAAASASAAFAVPDPPDNFEIEDAAPGAGFSVPISMAFLPDGRFFVGEKRGRVYEVRNGVRQADPTVAIENEVLNANDRGLLGIGVDPNYYVNHYIYLLYTVDPDSNGTETNNDAFGRLTRYQVNFTDSASVIPSSRTILMGYNWPNGPVSCSPSHSVGAIRWGHDGSMLIASGDGAQFSAVDAGGLDAPAFQPGRTDPYEDIGAFRSQYIGSLNGKILRLNPATGHGYASNPYATGDLTVPQSKVWVYGVRNPYRFCVRPGTGNTNPAVGDPGTLYLGDVGHDSYEEMNVSQNGGQNFGWPCYEGVSARGDYQSMTPAHHGCGSIGTPGNPAQATPPLSHWSHGIPSLSNPPGITGNTSTGGVFYTSTTYPVPYRSQYFYGDYGQNWIRVAVVDQNDNLTQVLDFATAADGPVDFAAHPLTGDVYYVAINAQQVRRIRYTGPTGGNNPPVAAVSANPLVGPAPLAVDFSSIGSFDPDNDTLSYSWLFADGGSSTAANPSHVYAAPGTYVAQLTLSDGQGGVDVEQVTIIAQGGTTGFPATGVLDNFNRANGPIGGPWVDVTAGLNISANALIQTVVTNSTVWNGAVFGSNQEAYFTFVNASASAAEQNLMLKVQGTSWSSGHIEVAYNASQTKVSVNTYAPAQGWVGRGTVNGVTFGAGDQFGARCDSVGLVRIFKNGSQVGSVSVAAWTFATAGGRLGMTLSEINGSVLDNFGGGTVVSVVNTPPTAQIITPLPDAFFYEDQEIALSGTGVDAQSPAESLLYTWVVDLHHNIHTHPASFTFLGPTATLLGENHDDGTGVFFRIHLIVADPGGLSDTTSVDIWPEADLEPSPVTVIPDPAIQGEPVEYRFTLRNHGRMPASISRWALLRGGVELAARDTVVAGEDSVLISLAGTAPAAGAYTLRVRADSLGTVRETDEANNASVRTLTVNVPPNSPPVAGIGLPADSSFYAAPDTLRLAADASDNEQPAATLGYLWHVRLHRSTGDSLVASFATDSADFITEDFEDGSGTWYEISLIVTDAGSLVDSASVTIRPEQDLSPGPIATNAGHVAAGAQTDAAFWLRNLGRAAARRTHWQLLLDGVVLAEDDTVVAALDSARVHVALPPGLSAGTHELRAVADTLDEAFETDESNNASMLSVTVQAVATDVSAAPVRALALSAPRPNPTHGAMSLTLDLPNAGEVGFDVLDLQGRVVSAQPAAAFSAGRWTLQWNGRLSTGAAAPPGLYLARVRVGETTLVRRIARVR